MPPKLPINLTFTKQNLIDLRTITSRNFFNKKPLFGKNEFPYNLDGTNCRRKLFWCVSEAEDRYLRFIIKEEVDRVALKQFRVEQHQNIFEGRAKENAKRRRID